MVVALAQRSMLPSVLRLREKEQRPVRGCCQATSHTRVYSSGSLLSFTRRAHISNDGLEMFEMVHSLHVLKD
jgi:hypothetical protein